MMAEMALETGTTHLSIIPHRAPQKQGYFLENEGFFERAPEKQGAFEKRDLANTRCGGVRTLLQKSLAFGVCSS